VANFLLVHGGFVGGWYWDDVARCLEDAGHRVDVVAQLPSVGTDPEQLGSLHDDVALVKQMVSQVQGPVVLVGHSYGGVVITELADDPQVVCSVYVAAFWPERGQSAMDLLADGPPMTWAALHEDGSVRVTDDLELLREILCADLDQRRAESYLRRFVPQSQASVITPSTAPELTHRTAYIICEQDRAVPPSVQARMAQAADQVERLPSAHNAPVSMPAELAGIISRMH
jgi:pimeloyl-ACP methyl ester carboxylesterase